MGTEDATLDLPAQIKALDTRLGLLVKRAGQMRRQAEKLASERARLLIAQEQARSRIKTMIRDLKTIEQRH